MNCCIPFLIVRKPTDNNGTRPHLCLPLNVIRMRRLTSVCRRNSLNTAGISFSALCGASAHANGNQRSGIAATQEISALAWHSIAELPSTYEENSQVLLAYFVRQLRVRVRVGKGQ